jgi:hypothetical protein
MRYIQGDAENQVAGFVDVEKAALDFGEGWPGVFPVSRDRDSQFTGVIRPPTWFLSPQYEKWSNIGT